MKKFKIPKKEVKKKKIEIVPKDILMNALRTLTTLSSHMIQIISKLEANSFLYENTRLSSFQRLMKSMKKAFGIKEAPVTYKINIKETQSQPKRTESICFSEFILKLKKRVKYYMSFSQKGSPGYIKIEQIPEEKISEQLTKFIIEDQKTILLLYGLDEFFKVNVPKQHSSKVKGIQIELTGIKNVLAKTMQIKTEYAECLEEVKSMKKMEAKDEE